MKVQRAIKQTRAFHANLQGVSIFLHLICGGEMKQPAFILRKEGGTEYSGQMTSSSLNMEGMETKIEGIRAMPNKGLCRE